MKHNVIAVAVISLAAASTFAVFAADTNPFTDFHGEAPGTVHHITAADLTKPYATQGVANFAQVVPRPTDAWPKALPGFKIDLFAEGLNNPRLITTAPNGDLFVAESTPGQILVFRGITADGKAQSEQTFATGLKMPFGIAFFPPGPNPRYVYVANTDSLVRFAYQNGDMKAREDAEMIIPALPSGGAAGGHWTRSVAFSSDGKQMFVSVGSANNIVDTDTTEAEHNRANILEANPDGSNLHVYASGIRNPAGLAIDPKTGEVWTSVNERDMLGDNLPPDYITHVQEGGFYGWPWFYTGGNPDPRMDGKHPELKDKSIVPDVLLEPHNASLQLTFYEGDQFPSEYAGAIFAAEHGSWNRSVRTGYEVILVPMRNGKAAGEYEDFLTGFVMPDGQVWGRPVGVAVASDGSLMVTDDGSNSIWRVSYEKQSVAKDVTISDDSPGSESLTSSNDGDLIVSSTTKSEIFRASKGAATADVWIKPGTNGLQRVLGVLADDRSGVLWACSSGSPTSAPTALKTFNLKTGAPKGSYDFPGGTGLCNDIAIAPDGTAYATDTTGGRVLRLKKDATTMEEWVKDANFSGLDGIALGDEHTIYVNNFFGGTLFRIPIGSDGAAGPVSEIKTSQPITRPDGMRSLRSNTFLLIEGGHLDRVTIDGDNAKIEVLKDGFNGVTAVTQTGNIAWVLAGKMNPNAIGPAKVYSVPLSEQ